MYYFRYTVGSVTTAIFGILNGGLQIGQSAMYIEAVSTARAAAVQIFRVIDREPLIDSSSSSGVRPGTCQGNIQLSNVVFSYPSRQDVRILNNISLNIESGSSVALVGSSGCGKSTIVQLIQRLYDPDQGSVSVDGVDLKQLNVGWLRDNIGVVGQEPVLFDSSIKQNIQLAKQSATEQEIESACREANAYDFISKLPDGLDTLVGEGGAQLSGGQKQRIAIARALIRNPRILLLDEATSALDNESEALVQEALDTVGQQRTTIIVAHRLSTVRNADKIVAIDGGEVREVGTHEELMNKNGLYYSLVNRQLAGRDENFEDEDNTRDTAENNVKMSNGISERQLSKQKSVIKKKTEDTEVKQSKAKLIWRLMMMNKPEWPYILIGCIFSIAFGALTPLFGTLFGDVMEVFYPGQERPRERMQTYALYFGGIGAGFMIAQIIMGFTFSVSGARLVERVRQKMFHSMLSQEIGWFDLEENNTGALCARLSSSAEVNSRF